jgi:serine/threonine protein kinase
MQYNNKGDLKHYLSNDFYNISWKDKLRYLREIITGLENMHGSNIIHKDFHSGNIFLNHTNNELSDGRISSRTEACIGDLGISKSAMKSADDNKKYGIIPYMAPEILHEREYTKASDIYSFGMIMWEFMTGRRPFWDKDHDTDLIIKICDGLRPPIVTNAPKGYIELMKKCWHSDPNKRPTAFHIHENFYVIDKERNNPTKVIKSSDIGPVTINNPSAIYKSRSLSDMITSAMSLRNSRSQSTINLETGKRFFMVS